jgi:hypothetical protein
MKFWKLEIRWIGKTSPNRGIRALEQRVQLLEQNVSAMAQILNKIVK